MPARNKAAGKAAAVSGNGAGTPDNSNGRANGDGRGTRLVIVESPALVLWTTGMSLMLLTLAFIRLGSPTSTTEVTVAASFLFLLPVYINSLTGGYASSRFKQLRHKGCWTFIYASVFVAIVAFMRDWPLWVSGVSSGLGIAASLVLFSIARFSSQGGRNIS